MTGERQAQGMDAAPTWYTWAITTSANYHGEQAEEARELAKRWSVPFLSRDRWNLQEIRHMLGVDYLLVLDRNRKLSVEEPLVLRWHPSMAIPRLRQLARGETDTFLSAVKLLPGDTVLDCTLGFGADALLASLSVGETGRILGLEASPLLALLTEYGLGKEAAVYESAEKPMKAISSRIKVCCCEAGAFLKTQSNNSWDVVYLDPMFRNVKEHTTDMNLMRPLTWDEPIHPDLLQEAFRVCKKRVVIKERRYSPLFAQLQAQETVRTNYGPVAFGVWEKK